MPPTSQQNANSTKEIRFDQTHLPDGLGPIFCGARFFEIHLYEPDQPWFSPEYVDFMAKLPVPVFMLEPVPSIPGSVAYPKEEVMRYFGPEAIFFWTSSLSWMFAMAIIEIERSGEPGEICLFGVDMSASEEVYSGQRAGCQYFAGQALRRGIKVSVPGQSDLLRPTPLYGFCEQDTMHQKLLARKAELEARLNAVNVSVSNLTAERTYLMGALEDVNYVKMTFVADPLAMEMLKAFGQSPEPLLRPIVAGKDDVEAMIERAAERNVVLAEAAEASTSFNPVNELIAGQKSANLSWESTPAPNFVNGLGA
jgi:hypothetical protein